MKKYRHVFGIDISKKSLDICRTRADNPKEMHHFTLSNDEKSIAAFFKGIKGKDVLFCLEDTGIYSMPLCYQLEEHAFDYTIIPAIHIHLSKGLKRGKTDKSDAKDIAIFALAHLHRLTLHHMPEEDLQELKLLLVERDKLVGAIKLFESSQESLQFIRRKTSNATVSFPEVRGFESRVNL